MNLNTVMDGASVDSGVAGGTALTRLVEAALREPAELPAARQAVVDELGEAALVEAAGVIGNFQRMVRIADSTGIPVDQRTATITEELREELGLNEFESARLES